MGKTLEAMTLDECRPPTMWSGGTPGFVPDEKTIESIATMHQLLAGPYSLQAEVRQQELAIEAKQIKMELQVDKGCTETI